MSSAREIGNFVKLDQKNRMHIPKDIMKLCGIEENGYAYVSVVLGENFIRVYPIEFLEMEKSFNEGRYNEN